MVGVRKRVLGVRHRPPWVTVAMYIAAENCKTGSGHARAARRLL